MNVLEVTNIRKSFDGEEVLKGIDFSMEKGEVVAIIGSSGSGKTTLLRCLNFLVTPDHGKILVNGEPVFDAEDTKKYSEEETREKRLHFGLVFQSFNLFPQYNVLRNITLASELRTEEILKEKKASKAEIKAAVGAVTERAKELLAQVGLAEKQNAYPCELSGGQQQRVAIARALALNPDILCFDEPTSALDPALTGEVLRVIRGLKSSDRTMIVVTHEMEFARKVADKVIYMADGIIEEMGEPEDIFEHPKSPKLVAFLENAREGL